MDKNDPKNIIKKHYRTLNKLIILVNKDFETEAIHKLRVEYKKLRAFLRMISNEKPVQEKIKIPKKLKKAYTIAGSIRDLHLQHKSILAITGEETKQTKAYLTLLEHRVRILQSQFLDIPSEKTIIKSIQKADELIVEKINEIIAGRFINNNCTAITAIIACRNFSDVNMHAIRKHLKDIFYTIQKLENADGEIKVHRGEILHEEKKYLDELLEEFGKLQDKCTSIGLLDDRGIHPLGMADRKILIKIRDTFTADRDAIKKNLVYKLQHEIIPHLQVFKNVGVFPPN